MAANGRQFVITVVLVLCAVRAAHGTSGWDAYSVDVGHYRIDGVVSAGGVWLLDPAGRQVEPAVFLAFSDKDGLWGPPKYILMQTHLLLVYGHAKEKDGIDEVNMPFLLSTRYID